MQRPTVRVTKMRIRHLRPGDVVNKEPDAMHGWFALTELRPLHDGSVSVVGKVTTLTFSGFPDDLVGVQVLIPMDFPEPPAPTTRPPGGAAAATPPPAAAPPPDTTPTPAGV